MFDNPYMFQGRRADVETQMLHFRNRYYNSRLGRFVSRDPMGVWYDFLGYGNGYISFAVNPISLLDQLGYDATGNYRGVDYEIDDCDEDQTNKILRELKKAIDKIIGAKNQLAHGLSMRGNFQNSHIGQNINKWFGSGDRNTARKVFNNIKNMLQDLRNSEAEIECEECCENLAGYVYVGIRYLFSPEIHLCVQYGLNAGTIIHEWTHERIGTEDYGYGGPGQYQDPETAGDPTEYEPANISGDTKKLTENADTYEGYIN